MSAVFFLLRLAAASLYLLRLTILCGELTLALLLDKSIDFLLLFKEVFNLILSCLLSTSNDRIKHALRLELLYFLHALSYLSLLYVVVLDFTI